MVRAAGANLFSIFTDSNVGYISHLMLAGRQIFIYVDLSLLSLNRRAIAVDNELVIKSLMVQFSCLEQFFISVKLSELPNATCLTPLNCNL